MFDSKHDVTQSRRDERTHLFLVATLYDENESLPVRIRNLSPQGALVEAKTLPAAGTALILRRGSLQARGHIAWVIKGRAGIAFTSPVIVADWLPFKGTAAQDAADRLSYSMRQSHRTKDQAEAPSAPDAVSKAMVTSELQHLQADLRRLGDQLSQDAILVAMHPEIQFLDAANQRIAKITQAIGSLID